MTPDQAIRQENPYVGARPFETGEVMYGRDWETLELRDLLIGRRVVLLHSPSGAGKTSLIQAGLIPALEENFHILPTIRMKQLPSSESLERGQSYNRYVLSTLMSLDAELSPELQMPEMELAAMDLAAYLAARRARTAGPEGEQAASPELLIFDQFEEILSVDPTDLGIKEAFFAQLAAVLRDFRYWALFAARDDYVGGLEPYLRYIPDRLSTRFRLDLLGVEAAWQAMQCPAKQAGVDFTDDAARQLVDDLRRVRIQGVGGVEEKFGPHVEPVQLQVVCRSLWEADRPDPAKITPDDVKRLKSVDDALGAYYDLNVAEIAQKTGRSQRRLRDWFDDKLITEQGLRGQVLQGQESQYGLGPETIGELINAYLVREEKRRGVTWYELAHDRLIEPVRKANEDWREDNLTPFQRQAALWAKLGEQDSLLRRDEDLKEAEGWAETHEDDLTEIEREFLKACRAALKVADAAQRAREAEAREREQAKVADELWKLNDQLRKRNVGLAILVAAAAIAAVLAIWFGWQSSQNAQRAQQAEGTAIEQQKIAEAERDVAKADLSSADDARAALEAILEVNLTAQASLAEATPEPPTATPTPSPTATPTGTLALPPETTPTATPTASPTPTPNQTVEFLATELAKVRATQTVVAKIASCVEPQGELRSVWNKHKWGLGCGTNAAHTSWIAQEHFEHGQMFWRKDNDYVFALYSSGTWASYLDIWQEGDPEYSCPDSAPTSSPPSPRMGFGKIWCSYSEVRAGLGWATDYERGFDGTVQDFETGTILRTDTGETYVLYGDGTWTQW